MWQLHLILLHQQFHVALFYSFYFLSMGICNTWVNVLTHIGILMFITHEIGTIKVVEMQNSCLPLSFSS